MANLGNKNAERHGYYGTPTYETWVCMLKRCRNTNMDSFVHYGARGIRVCKKWLKFEGFIEDMGLRPEGHTLDRIDVDGDYCKENCQWSDLLRQQRGRRNVYLTWEKACEIRRMHSEGFSRKEIAVHLNVAYHCVVDVILKRRWKTQEGPSIKKEEG